MNKLFPYRWSLSDGFPAKEVEYKNHQSLAFGTFIGGGGSSMGYKLAGYNHLGGVEIDPKMAGIYKSNLSPTHLFIDDLREFNERTDLPDELYQLDLLDGSPPCSTFSTAGKREKAWGKEKQFTEGQAKQRLDDLVFTYLCTIMKLRPKVAILENVSGLIKGNAKAYAMEIARQFSGAGYQVQIFKLNAATMGVPQARERVFFIGVERRYAESKKLKPLSLEFYDSPITFQDIERMDPDPKVFNLTDFASKLWKGTRMGKGLSMAHPRGKWYNAIKVHPEKPLPTITATTAPVGQLYHYSQPRFIDDKEYILGGSFPQDYDFGKVKVKYVVGMSVPPVMTAQIAYQIYLQWLK